MYQRGHSETSLLCFSFRSIPLILSLIRQRINLNNSFIKDIGFSGSPNFCKRKVLLLFLLTGMSLPNVGRVIIRCKKSLRSVLKSIFYQNSFLHTGVPIPVGTHTLVSFTDCPHCFRGGVCVTLSQIVCKKFMDDSRSTTKLRFTRFYSF